MPGPEGVVSIAVVCEGPTDLPTVCDLTDRVAAEELGSDDHDEIVRRREFRGVKPGNDYLAWSDVKSIAREMRIRFHGHFNNAGVKEIAMEDAQTTRKALQILKACKNRPDAVILVRDSDRREERLKGMTQARDETGYEFAIAIGVAHTKRECWVLCGYQPIDKHEAALHQEMRQELGFDPCLNSHELTAKHDSDKKSAKRVLAKLTQDDLERASRCWNEAELQLLRDRGKENGLIEFLDELQERVAPLFAKVDDA